MHQRTREYITKPISSRFINMYTTKTFGGTPARRMETGLHSTVFYALTLPGSDMKGAGRTMSGLAISKRFSSTKSIKGNIPANILLGQAIELLLRQMRAAILASYP